MRTKFLAIRVLFSWKFHFTIWDKPMKNHDSFNLFESLNYQSIENLFLLFSSNVIILKFNKLWSFSQYTGLNQTWSLFNMFFLIKSFRNKKRINYDLSFKSNDFIWKSQLIETKNRLLWMNLLKPFQNSLRLRFMKISKCFCRSQQNVLIHEPKFRNRSV